MGNSDYRESLMADAVFVPEVEEELMKQPPGVAEAYYVSVSTFGSTIGDLVKAAGRDNPEAIEMARVVIHRLVAGVAGYAYVVGAASTKEEEK